MKYFLASWTMVQDADGSQRGQTARLEYLGLVCDWRSHDERGLADLGRSRITLQQDDDMAPYTLGLVCPAWTIDKEGDQTWASVRRAEGRKDASVGNDTAKGAFLAVC